MLTIMERKTGESARDYVTRVLIDNIVNVHLEPGEKLLENDLSGQLGVSRTPYREAVLALAERLKRLNLCILARKLFTVHGIKQILHLRGHAVEALLHLHKFLIGHVSLDRDSHLSLPLK